MNFKKIFFILLFVCSTQMLHATTTGMDDSEKLKIFEKVSSLAEKNNLAKIALCFHGTSKEQILYNISVVPLNTIDLLVYYCTYYDNDELSNALSYIQQEDPELIQRAFDRYISKIKKIHFPKIKTFIRFGANIHANLPGKDYNAHEALQARLKANNCNGIWSRVFGQSNECREMEKGLNLFEELRKQKTATEEKH